MDVATEDLRQEVFRTIQVIDRDEAALRALIKAGHGTGAEAQMLRDQIRAHVENLKSQHGDIFSSESGERLRLIGGSAREMSIRELAIGPGLKGEFTYNASGRVVGFVSEMKTDKDAVKALVENDAWNNIYESNDKRLLTMRIFEDQKAYDALAKAGRASSAEAKYLKSEIEILAKGFKVMTGGAISEKGLKSLKALSDETREHLARKGAS